MRLLPEGIAELDPNIRWDIATRLQLIEDVVLGPRTPASAHPPRKKRKTACAGPWRRGIRRLRMRLSWTT